MVFAEMFFCETQLITTIEEIVKALDNGKQIDHIIMNFSKTFDLVSHQRLIRKLNYYGMRGHLKHWLVNWLTCREQSLVADGASCLPAHVCTGVTQRTVFLYINGIGNQCSSTLRPFADDTMFFDSVTEPNGDAKHLQSDLSNIKQWSQKWVMQFNPSKYFVMRIT